MSDVQQGSLPEGEEQETTLARIWWWVWPCLLAVAVTLLARTFLIEPFIVPTSSMEDTIMPGNAVLTEKVTYLFEEPKPGDIVVFKNPAGEGDALVKRIVATEGQTVDLQDGFVYVDGERLEEPYTGGKVSKPLSIHADYVEELTYPYTVPEGRLWVMGDNRTNSKDSRYFGSIEASSVIGHGVAIVWPLSDIHGF